MVGAVQTSVKLSREAVEQWLGAMVAAGTKVVAPVESAGGGCEYRVLTPTAAKATGLGKGLPRVSPKSAWFPRSEPILKMSRQGRDWKLDDPEMQFPAVVIFGARACDAAAPEILAPLFGWDFHDAFFEERKKSLAFVVLACQQSVDAACFCTSVGVDPAGQNVGDVTLTPLADGGYIAQANTATGETLLATATGAKAADEDLSAGRAKVRELIARQFDPKSVRTALEKRFGDPIWERASRSCIACGTCAFSCPTCHCFDIQDEMVGDKGLRQKNWDACAFPLFTLHTSGHNPRADQAGRWRQRISHKFRYYPEKFGKTLCTGCGRCIRLCPASMDMLADLKELDQTQAATPQAAAPASNPDCACHTGAVPGVQAINPANSPNIYRPYLMRVAQVRDETPDVRTLRLEFTNPDEAAKFSFRVGQFGLYSAIGEGESTFCVASSPTRKGYIECTFRQAGRVTKALRRLNEGDLMGFRGAYGNSFPVESWKGKDLLFVAGGIALPPMRAVIQYCLDNRADYGDITIVYGAKTWSDHVYKDELAEWEKRSDVNLWLCVDWKMGPQGPVEAQADADWRPINMKEPGATQLDPAHRRYTAFVPQLVEAAKPSPANRIAVLCGPPIMIKFTMASLKKLGYESQNVFTTLENRMKCGVGKCGRCNVGPIYVCKEGPVFTAKQVEALPPEM